MFEKCEELRRARLIQSSGFLLLYLKEYRKNKCAYSLKKTDDWSNK